MEDMEAYKDLYRADKGDMAYVGVDVDQQENTVQWAVIHSMDYWTYLITFMFL